MWGKGLIYYLLLLVENFILAVMTRVAMNMDEQVSLYLGMCLKSGVAAYNVF